MTKHQINIKSSDNLDNFKYTYDFHKNKVMLSGFFLAQFRVFFQKRQTQQNNFKRNNKNILCNLCMALLTHILLDNKFIILLFSNFKFFFRDAYFVFINTEFASFSYTFASLKNKQF